MTDYVTLIASREHSQGLMVGPPSHKLVLTDDSNSAGGDLTTDWTADPQLTLSAMGGFLDIDTNIAIEVALCGAGEAPSSNNSIPLRPSTSSRAGYTLVTDGHNRIFVRRLA